MLTLRSEIDNSRSFGITISVSHSSRRPSIPVSACSWRRRPSNPNGRVTTPMVNAPMERATLATTGAPPVPVPPPSPAVLLGRLPADLGVGAGAQSSGQLTANIELDVGVAHQQRLGIGVDGDELDALEADFDHSVDGINASPADADHLDHSQVVLRSCHDEMPLARSVAAPA